MRLGVLACAIVIGCDHVPAVDAGTTPDATHGFAAGESSEGSSTGHGGAGAGGSASGGSASGGQSTTWSIGATSDGESTSGESSSTDTTGVDPVTPMGEAPDVDWISVSGFVEAGPFVAGSTVEIWVLDTLGYPHSIVATTEVMDDTGAFGPVDVPAAVLLVRAEGRYFDIAADIVSDAALRLEVVAHADGTPIHVNVLGHITRPAILERLQAGYSIAGAFSIETQTVLGVLGSTVLAAAPPYLNVHPSGLSLQGPDDRPNAFLLATTAVLQSATRFEAPLDPTTALQVFIDALAADEAELQITEHIVDGPYALDPDEVRTALYEYYQAAGMQIAPADLDRVIDADDDWVWNIDDNCPTISNEWQDDSDQDGIGDLCECDMNGPDPDGDGWPSGCDTCDDVPNAPYSDHFPGFWENPNMDGDEWGNACDSCPRSHGVGGVPDENCCDPRGPANCSKTVWTSNELFRCTPRPSGERFGCTSYNYCDSGFGVPPGSCGDNSLPWLDPGGLPASQWCEEGASCTTRWCTVGDDTPCTVVGEEVTCIPWLAPEDPPEGLKDLGICALAADGPCKGIPGIECAHWFGEG